MLRILTAFTGNKNRFLQKNIKNYGLEQMLISIVVAMSQNNVIGKNNALPWHLPADLQHFKNTTMGKPIIMGRKTFESLGKPLPNRTTIIITRNKNYKQEGCIVVNSLQQAIEASPAKMHMDSFLSVIKKAN